MKQRNMPCDGMIPAGTDDRDRYLWGRAVPEAFATWWDRKWFQIVPFGIFLMPNRNPGLEFARRVVVQRKKS